MKVGAKISDEDLLIILTYDERKPPRPRLKYSHLIIREREPELKTLMDFIDPVIVYQQSEPAEYSGQRVLLEKPEINSPDRVNGVRDFMKRKEDIQYFSDKIDKGMEVSQKSMDRIIDI